MAKNIAMTTIVKSVHVVHACHNRDNVHVGPQHVADEIYFSAMSLSNIKKEQLSLAL